MSAFNADAFEASGFYALAAVVIVPVTGWQPVASAFQTWAQVASPDAVWTEAESGAQTWATQVRQPTEWQS